MRRPASQRRAVDEAREARGARARALVLAGAAFAAASCSRGGGGEQGAAPAGSAGRAASAGAGSGADAAARRQLAAVKELAVRKLAPGAAIAIDGRLDEPAWQAAARTGPFVNVSTGREDRSLPTQGEARLLWDDAFLYVAFDVSDRTITGGFPEDARDPHLWERDTVEVMIDPDGDGDNKDYYEIQINPQNLVFDSQFDDYNAPRGGPSGPFGHQEWSAGLASAVELRGTIDDDSDEDRGYVVEAKIPWSSFAKAKAAPPSPGDAWRMNFYAMQNNGGAAWSPILGEGNFHRARRFGRVRFVGTGGETGGAPAGGAAAAAATDAGAAAARDAGAAPVPMPSAKPPGATGAAGERPGAAAPSAPAGPTPGYRADPPDR
ncbi:carbohydrate-binding family 9-like protein [Sorangium sp. So ce1097]|uniref:carbohydrate-binding family 9-like protein n=1 Tax=Sorangium sp. So ce1097 TaxID=3133330 RepID=UPI003F628258